MQKKKERKPGLPPLPAYLGIFVYLILFFSTLDYPTLEKNEQSDINA